MSDVVKDRLQKGVRNLFFDCGGCAPGDTVLIVHERENDGYYDADFAQTVANCAIALGLTVEQFAVPFVAQAADPSPALAARMDAADCTVFLARLGDQIRFRAKSTATTRIISYALDREMLASPFGTIRYAAFEGLKQLINAAISAAQDIHVTCPLGTDFRGSLAHPLTADGEVTSKRFPVSVFAPVPAVAFRGCIAQRGFLTGTGSNYYDPYTCELKDTLTVAFDGNRITGFDGSSADVAAARGHYEHVGKTFGIDPFFVHSWHAGIHPGCDYRQTAAMHFERWSNGAFGNPRLLHFHTCGAYPPGEISLNILDTTVRLDGVPVWEQGRLNPDLITGGSELLDREPDMRALFEAPSPGVGQAHDNKLSFV